MKKILYSLLSLGILSNVAFAQADQKQNQQQVEELRTEAFAAGTEQKAVNQLKLLLNKYKGSSTEPALLFRLAELYMSQSRSARVFEMYREDNKDSVEAMSFLPQSVTSQREKKLIKDAIKVYEDIEKKYPKFEQLDMVIFNNGFAYLQVDDKQGAEAAFMRLLKNKRLKDSPVMADALLALGEIAFQAHIFGKALAFYELIEQYPDNKVYPYALYKSSWCKYNLQDPSGALLTMEKVVAIGHDVEAKGLDSKLDLRRESLNDMTLFFSESKPSNEGLEYFKRQAKKIDPALYIEKLSRIYNGHGKLKDEELILSGLISGFSSNPRLPIYHKRLSENSDAQNNIAKAVENLKAFDKTCDIVLAKTKMPEAPKLEDPEIEECAEDVDRYSLRVAKNWLKSAEKMNKKVYEAAAEEALRVNLRDQKATDENSAARYIFADLLFKSDKFKEASEQYELVGGSVKDETKAHDSRYAAIVSHDKAVKNNWDDPSEKRLKNLVDTYLTKHPNGKYFLDVSFKVGLFDYQKKNFADAEPRFYQLGKRFYDKDKGKKAQDLYLDILNSKKDFVALQKGALEWKSLETDDKRKKDLQVIFEQAYFSHTQVLVKEEKYDEAITLYRQFALNYSDSDLADEAQWNVVDLYFKKGDSPGAASAYVDFYQKFPKHERAIEGLVRAADLYEQMSMPDRALEVTKILARVDKKNFESWVLLSGDFLAASGKYYEAIHQYRDIFSRYTKSMSSHGQQAIDRVIFLSDQLGTQSEYLDIMKQMSESQVANVYSPATAVYADGLKKLGSVYTLMPWLKNAQNKKLLPEDLAKINLIAAELQEASYHDFKISDYDMQVLTRDIGTKSKKLGDVQATYQAATNGGDAYTTVNALVGLANLYQGFVTGMNDIRGPASFSDEERQALKDELSNVAFPFEEKAVETVDTALKFAKKSDLRDGSVGRVQKILDRLNMKERTISSIDEYLPGPVYVSAPKGRGK
ncbi:MAG: tetratricopeptide repeat protein [Bdellovibrionaceae bacterium]|nr:tetratricopeptide repeat protein [Pseudobdellovibrionaceae bacterium]